MFKWEGLNNLRAEAIVRLWSTCLDTQVLCLISGTTMGWGPLLDRVTSKPKSFETEAGGLWIGGRSR